jgi:chromate transporter
VALYNAVWRSSVKTSEDFGLIAFLLLTVWRAPPRAVVIISALSGGILAQTTL